jgi:hypothetical protein
MDEKAAVWTGAGTAMLFQTTVEIMDGFSREWGFSWYDMAFNAIGAGSFLFQQLHWGEQRIVFKFSANYVDYDPTFFGPVEGDATQRSSRKLRANDLFGSGSLPRMIKDYNGQTYWASLNIASFIKDRTGFPGWLNIAAGYGATNMYGAHDNTWEENDATFYIEDPRLHSFYLSTDIDLRKIKSKSAVVRTILDILNLIKIPLPTLEFRSDGQINWHWVYF